MTKSQLIEKLNEYPDHNWIASDDYAYHTFDVIDDLLEFIDEINGDNHVSVLVNKKI